MGEVFAAFISRCAVLTRDPLAVSQNAGGSTNSRKLWRLSLALPSGTPGQGVVYGSSGITIVTSRRPAAVSVSSSTPDAGWV